MRKFVIIAVLLLAGCANQDFNRNAAVPSEITGFYSSTNMLLTVIHTNAVLLRSDGTGFWCSSSSDKPAAKKTPVKHIGGNVWAMASFGTAEIIKHPDGSISWGASHLQPGNIEDSNCQ